MRIAPSLKWGARVGYVARGIVYLVVGVFAILAAAGSGEAEGTHGALRELLAQPLGGLLLGLVALGLLAFAGWRFAQAVGDLDRHGAGAKGIAIRVALFGSGVIHLALAGFSFAMLFHIGSSEGSGDPTGGWLTWLFAQPWGHWLALALALVPVAVGVAHVVKALRAGYEKYLVVDADLLAAMKPICSFGLIARGVIFVLIGVLAVYAGGVYDVKSAPGLEDALAFLQGLPFGAILFLVTALGLVAFAAYCFIEAAYRRVGSGGAPAG
jgi:hypothetical protein